MDEETIRQINAEEMEQRRIEAKIEDWEDNGYRRESLRRWILNKPPHYWDEDEEEEE